MPIPGFMAGTMILFANQELNYTVIDPKTWNLGSARRSPIEAQHSERGSPFPEGKGDDEDRLGEVIASPNSKF